MKRWPNRLFLDRRQDPNIYSDTETRALSNLDSRRRGTRLAAPWDLDSNLWRRESRSPAPRVQIPCGAASRAMIENTKALYFSMALCLSLLLLLIAIQEESHFKTALFLEESKLQSVLCYIYSLKASKLVSNL